METIKIKSREAREKWRDLLDAVYSGKADVIIERNGKPVAVLISADDYEEIQDELDDLRAARMAGLVYEEWKRNPASARPYEEIRADLVNETLLDE